MAHCSFVKRNLMFKFQEKNQISLTFYWCLAGLYDEKVHLLVPMQLIVMYLYMYMHRAVGGKLLVVKYSAG